MQTILVMGTESGVGRTTFAINLAINSSLYDKKKTMLLDLNCGQEKISRSLFGTVFLKGMDDLASLESSNMLTTATFPHVCNRVNKHLAYVSAPLCFDLKNENVELLIDFSERVGFEVLVVDGCIDNLELFNNYVQGMDHIFLLGNNHESMINSLTKDIYLANKEKIMVVLNNNNALKDDKDAVAIIDQALNKLGYSSKAYTLPFDKQIKSYDKDNNIMFYAIEWHHKKYGQSVLNLLGLTKKEER